MSNQTTEAVLPNWYDPEKFKGLIVIQEDGISSIASKYATGVVKWTSDCKYCLSQMDSDFYPNHTASQYCESGKHFHCTCPRCWG